MSPRWPSDSRSFSSARSAMRTDRARPGHPDHDHRLDAQSQPTPFSACTGLPTTLTRTPSVCETTSPARPGPAFGQRSRSPDEDLHPTRRLHSAVSTRNRIDQDQGTLNPVCSPASRRATGASIAHERALSQIALPLALPFALPAPAFRPSRLTRPKASSPPLDASVLPETRSHLGSQRPAPR
jgi:hypothetical protein